MTGRVALATVLKGEPVAWADRSTADAFLRVCREEGVTGLVCDRLTRQGIPWPAEISPALTHHTRAQAASELLCQKEVIGALDALALEGVYPVLLKGTALAYSVYRDPAWRPRVDTDLLIRRDEADRVRRVMNRLGYSTPPFCDLLFGQFPAKKVDAFGAVHTLDFHWRISTQSVFADALTFEETADAATPLPALGPHARCAGPVHALLLACIHPVMHHQNTESLVWVYDVHLLASRLSPEECSRFAELACTRRMSAVAAHQLAAARRWFGTRMPDSVIRRLHTDHRPEPSATYLHTDRRWLDELVSNVRGLPRWTDRVRLLREVVLPRRSYMFQSHHLEPSWFGMAVLPLLYLHRLASGCWRILAGQK